MAQVDLLNWDQADEYEIQLLSYIHTSTCNVLDIE